MSIAKQVGMNRTTATAVGTALVTGARAIQDGWATRSNTLLTARSAQPSWRGPPPTRWQRRTTRTRSQKARQRVSRPVGRPRFTHAARARLLRRAESAHARKRNAASAPRVPQAPPCCVRRTTASWLVLKPRAAALATEWRHATEDLEVHGVKREGSHHPVPENPLRNHISGQQYKQVTSS